jgi:hypothetical protein
MMEKKRTRAWRRHQVRRVYKARLKYVAAIRIDEHVIWKDLLGEHGTLVYKTTGTPCSCWLCKGESYDRAKTSQECRRVVNDALDDSMDL